VGPSRYVLKLRYSQLQDATATAIAYNSGLFFRLTRVVSRILDDRYFFSRPMTDDGRPALPKKFQPVRGPKAALSHSETYS